MAIRIIYRVQEAKADSKPSKLYPWAHLALDFIVEDICGFADGLKTDRVVGQLDVKIVVFRHRRLPTDADALHCAHRITTIPGFKNARGRTLPF